MIDPLLDQVVDGWHILLKVGQGATGTVYEAHHGEARAALKVIRPGVVSAQSVARFQREARVLSELEHPHIVRCLGAGEGEGFLYVVLEFLDAGSLDRQLRERGRVSVEEAVGVGQGLLAALVAAHASGVVHRDVKPANLLLDAQGAVKLADFNLARQGTIDQEITTTGTIVGTPYYMAPEQVEAEEPGPAADLYAVGAVLYHLIAGHPPFEGSSSLAVLQKHLKEPVPDLSAEVSDVPVELCDLITDLLAKDPSERPDGPGALARLATLESAPFQLVEAPMPVYARRAQERSDSKEGIDTAAWQTFNLEPTRRVGSTASKRWEGGPASSSVDLLGSDDGEPPTDLLSLIDPVPVGSPACAAARPLPRGSASAAGDALSLSIVAAFGLGIYDRFMLARGSDIFAPLFDPEQPALRALRAASESVPPWVIALTTTVFVGDRVLARTTGDGFWVRLGLRAQLLACSVFRRHKQAGALLERLGKREGAARYLRRAGLYREAAAYFEAAGRFEEQAEVLLEADNRAGALAAYRAADTPRARYNAGLLGDTSRQAADALLERGEVERAARAHLQGGRPFAAADVLEQAGRIADAVQALGTAYSSGRAAESSSAAPLEAARSLARRIAGFHLELEELVQAAEWYEEASELETAGELYARLGDSLGRARCLSRELPSSGRLSSRQKAQAREAARLYAEAQDPAGVPIFARIGDYTGAAELSRNLGDDAQAAQHFARAGRPGEGALCAERAGNRALAAFLFREAGQHERAIALYEALGEFKEAAEAASRAGDPQEQARLFESMGDFLSAAQALKTLSRDTEAIELLGRISSEHEDYTAGNRLAADLHYAAKRLRMAARCYEVGLPLEVRVLADVGPSLRYAEALEQLGEPRRALEVLARFQGTSFGPPDLRQREARLRGELERAGLADSGASGALKPPASGARRVPPPARPRSSSQHELPRTPAPSSSSSLRRAPPPPPSSKASRRAALAERAPRRPAAAKEAEVGSAPPASGRGRRGPPPPPGAMRAQPEQTESGQGARRSPDAGDKPRPASGRQSAPAEPRPASGRQSAPAGPRPASGRQSAPAEPRPASGRQSAPAEPRPASGRQSAPAEPRPASGRGSRADRNMDPKVLEGRVLGAGLAQAALGQLLGVTPLAWIYSAQLAGAPATVKVLRPELETEARRAAWAGLAERWGGARAGSPAILAGSALPEERAFLAFEVVRGEGLDRVLARGELPEAQRRGILRAIGRSLSEAHSAGVAHLDLRPSKVSLGRQALLVDLGLLATIGAGAPLRELLDPRYAAPEQADGALGDRASDVYQLALLACKVLYGRLPFSATRAEDFWELKLHAEPDLEGVPEQTRGAFARALARDPAARYPDAAACCQALGL